MKTRRQLIRRTATRLVAIGALAAAIAVIAGVVGAAPNNLASNPSLENGTGATPTCWLLGGYGSNTYSWSRTSDAHSGSYGETLSISSLSNGDRKLLTGFTTSCSPTATAGHTYTVTVWYKSDAPVVIFAFTRKTGAATNSYQWWKQGSAPASATWRQATWQTPSMPSGIAQLSVGLGLQRTGTVTMDDFSIVDDQAQTTDTTAPTSSIACNGSSCGSGYYSGPVSVSLSAADDSGGSGVNMIRYTTDGSIPTLANGTTYTSAFTLSSSTVVNYRSYDKAGNVEIYNSTPVQVDSTAPTVALSAPASATGTVALTATASDNVSVSSVQLQLDGKTVATDNAYPYTFNWDTTQSSNGQHTLSAKAADEAGNSAFSATVTVNVSNIAKPPPATTSSTGTTTGNTTTTAPTTTTGTTTTAPTPPPTTTTGTTTTAPAPPPPPPTTTTGTTTTAPAPPPPPPPPTTTTPSSQPPPSGTTISGTLPSGTAGLPKSDSSCAGQVYQSTWEPWPSNTTANNTVPANPSAVPWSNQGIPPSFSAWYVKRGEVTGNYKGTTDEIIQWAACKWGIDPNLMRAVAVQESDWHANELGDVCGPVGEASYGLFQVKNKNCSGEGDWGGYPDTLNETALNADFYGAQMRACLDGDFASWLYSNVNTQITNNGYTYVIWGCVGAWFSGDWYGSGAKNYISGVQGYLASRAWLTEGK